MEMEKNPNYVAPPAPPYKQPQQPVQDDRYLSDEKVRLLQEEIEKNSCDGLDVCLYLLFGPFAFFCIIPKLNRKSSAKDKLKIELTKPRRP
ncbi:hypothetical protein [Absidia glauca]|jgi:hypothetical protein|uniref:Uncharacterized protein n=1 Tax=Absidia glauca TaxID=4829 RepID=A0A163JKH3_ABSGL|nr:hypothetical protein [Absidia glauca]